MHTMTDAPSPPPAPSRPRCGARIALLYLLAGLAWSLFGGLWSRFLGALVLGIFLAAFVASAAVPAWRAERRWAGAGVAVALCAFLGAWLPLIAVGSLSESAAMLGCRMHEVDEGGLPDAVCMGPLSLYSEGRRALWMLPVYLAFAASAALGVAAAARGLRALLSRRLPALSRRAAGRLAAAAWIIPVLAIPAALAGDRVLAERARVAEAQRRAVPPKPSASVFFRSEDDSLEVGDRTRLVAWVWFSEGGGSGSRHLDGVRLSFSSSAPHVARVDSTGTVTAVGQGTARIVVTGHALAESARLAHGQADTLRIRVAPPDPAVRGLRFVGAAVSLNEVWSDSCAVTADGAAYCVGSSDERVVDTLVAEPPRFRRTHAPEPLVSLMLGQGHRCAVGRSGRGYCWGMNRYGQLGTGGGSRAARPVEVAGGHRWRMIRTGRDHTCGITTDDALFCWGADRVGEIAPAGSTEVCSRGGLWDIVTGGRRDPLECATKPLPVLAAKRFREVAPGAGHTCALEVDGDVWCWGANYNHQTGRPSSHSERAPNRVQVPPLVHLASGNRHICGVDARGAAYCWGWYPFVLDRRENSGTGVFPPVPVPAPRPLRALALGDEHSCGLAEGGEAYCWAGRAGIELGSGATRDVDIPTGAVLPVAGGIRFRALAAGRGHTCGISLAGGWYCWGHGLDFRFAGANLQEHPQPFRIGGPPE
jgi:alpha-tubulin suppressor-like RCC1 family protein